MIFAAVPAVDGHFAEAEKSLYGTGISWALCPGSMGIWPDPYYVSGKAKQWAGTDFSKRYLHQDSMKYPFLFVRGAHEDHFWLKRRREAGVGLELLPGLTWLVDGYKTCLQEDLRVTGLGGVYSPKYYDSKEGWKTKLRGYRRSQVEKACSSGPTDILLIHEHPTAEGISSIVFATRPKLIIYPAKDGYYHDEEVLGVRAVGCVESTPYTLFEWKDSKISDIG